MKKFILPLVLFLGFKSFSQSGYEIKINFKNAPDSTYYLAKYTIDKSFIIDSCKHVKNGVGVFKGKNDLEKGVYILASQGKGRYFDFFVNESSKFSISTDYKDLVNNFKCVGTPENELAFSYLRFMTNINRDFAKAAEKTKGLPKQDSIKIIEEKQKTLHESVTKFNEEFTKAHKGTFFLDFLNLQTEKTAKQEDIPKASNGRPDSIWYSNYYRSHYWDGVNFADDRVYHTPFFGDRLKKYFDQVVYPVPDSLIKEIDKILSFRKPESDLTKILVSNFLFDFETKAGKIVGFDKVFVHIIDKYIRTGWTKGYYNDATIEKIKERGDILKPLLLDSPAPDLLMVDTTAAKIVNRMGFDTAKTSASVSKLYYENMNKLVSLYTPLYSVKAKYVILAFWDVECSHCLTEMPKLMEAWHEMRKTLDIKVYAVYTQHDYEKWRKFIIEKKYDFINVYDAVHINNIKTKYDIFSTPKIYILDKNKLIKSKGLSHDQVPNVIKMLEEMEKNKK